LPAFALVVMAIIGPFADAVPAGTVHTSDEPSSVDLYVAETGDDAPTNPCVEVAAPCASVSGAVDRAQTAIADGAVEVTVHIAAGTYTENVGIGSVASGHRLRLVGVAASTTTVHGLGTASVIEISDGAVDISGLTITGGHAVDGGGIHNGAGTLTVSDATVSGNAATGVDEGGGGGGGIYNGTGTVTLTDTTVSENTRENATGFDKFGGGGGIYNDAGTLEVVDSAVSDNTTSAYAGGIYNKAGVVTVSGSVLSGNSGYYVGGIHNRGTLTVSDTTMSDNTATANFGGGISNFAGTMAVSNATLTGNSATNTNVGLGGAIFNKAVATITNATLTGNSAYRGGAIYSSNKTISVTSSTLSGNAATSGGSGFYWAGGTSATIASSILSASSCNQLFGATNPKLVDGGYNVNDDSSCFTGSTTSTIGSTTIGLAPLAANGSTGPQTMAIDATSSAHLLVPGCTGTDARGLERPGFGGTANCDAGAYELQASAPTVTTDPLSQTVAIGSDATFVAAASGTPDPTVRWQVDTGEGWTDVPGATATTLTLTDVAHTMSGNRYRAVFTNGIGTDATTAAATLTVPVGPLDHLVLSPSSASVLAGVAQAFTATGFDSSGNSLGDLTGTTLFTGSAGLVCTAASCTSSIPGTYAVTGTNGGAVGAASLTVTATPAGGVPTIEPNAPEPPIDVPSIPEPPTSDTGGGAPSPPGAALPSGEVISLQDGEVSSIPRAAPPDVEVVAGAVTPTGEGAWSVSATGEVFTTGDAPYLGDTNGGPLNAAIVGVAPTASGDGYWLVGSDGGIFSFGDAEFFGSTADLQLNQPVVGLAPTPTGQGYWVVARDGGIFTFGDAPFLGSTGAMRLQAPIIAMAPTPDGSGYWLLGADGGVFAFGSAGFFGSTGGDQQVGSIVAMVPTASGRGYSLVGADREVYEFGDA
jgi:hypothetical protein